MMIAAPGRYPCDVYKQKYRNAENNHTMVSDSQIEHEKHRIGAMPTRCFDLIRFQFFRLCKGAGILPPRSIKDALDC